MRRILLASVAVAATFALMPSPAQAQWGGTRFGLSINSGGYGYGGYRQYSGYGGSPPNVGYGRFGSYYGNGGHDYQPHWHTTQTPYGPNAWYGNGPHDFVPHAHTRTPWSYQGYSNTGAGPTVSHYNPQPPYFAPW